MVKNLIYSPYYDNKSVFKIYGHQIIDSFLKEYKKNNSIKILIYKSTSL